MPKTGPTAEEWKKRLASYAHRKFVFGKGQHPRKGSHWAAQIEEINKCPRQTKALSKDLFGNLIRCTCGYHDIEVSVKCLYLNLYDSQHVQLESWGKLNYQDRISCYSSPHSRYQLINVRAWKSRILILRT